MNYEFLWIRSVSGKKRAKKKEKILLIFPDLVVEVLHYFPRRNVQAVLVPIVCFEFYECFENVVCLGFL